ncbi:30S ribosomal protein S2 [Candidatus Falkowbacteria bacterium]|nr:30S ribosomal protein S2 [Candidatus Falkowbacteria bacterium]
MSKVPSIEAMLSAGVHFGHQAPKWYPKMEQYIFGVRNGVHVIDLEQTHKALEQVEKVITQTVSTGGTVLFVGTKAQAKEVIEAQAKRCNMPFVSNRWVGGLLTNFRIVIKQAKKLKDLVRQRDTGELNKYTKKEQLKFEQEIERLEGTIGGVKDLTREPNLLVIVDLKVEETALLEAAKKKIPVIALCDTNVDPSLVDYVVPANDDAKKGVELLIAAMADMVLEAQKKIVKA